MAVYGLGSLQRTRSLHFVRGQSLGAIYQQGSTGHRVYLNLFRKTFASVIFNYSQAEVSLKTFNHLSRLGGDEQGSN